MKARNILPFGLYLMFMTAGLTICEDQVFTIAFMTNINSDRTACNNNHLSLYISASEITRCSISAPKSDFDTSVITSDVVEVQLPRWLALSGSTVEQKGLAVSCNNTVSVYGINACKHNTDGFSAIPNTQLGNEYYAFTVSPSEMSYKSQVAVVSYLDDTDVYVRLPSCADCNVNFYEMYDPGSTICRKLNAYESMQIQSKGNLTGTYIYSNNPVAVFSGNDRSSIPSVLREHLVTQVTPLKYWGKRFVVVSPISSYSTVFVLSGTDDTQVQTSCTGTTQQTTKIIFSAGETFQQRLSHVADEYCFIETNYPVFAVQVIGMEPSLLSLTPIEHYSANYSFIPPKTSEGINFDKHFFIYVIEESAASELILDSRLHIQNSNQRKIPGTNLTAGYFIITDNQLHHVTHPYKHFNGILFGHGSGESYSISLGQNWKDLTTNWSSLQPTTVQALQCTTNGIQTTVKASQETDTKLSSDVNEKSTTTYEILSTAQAPQDSTDDILSTAQTLRTSTLEISSPSQILEGSVNCLCPCSVVSTKWQKVLKDVFSQEELVRLVLNDFEQNIKPSMLINRNTLSKTTRKKISAKNTDPTEQNIGWGFAWIIVVPIVFAILSDMLNLCRFCARRKKRVNRISP